MTPETFGPIACMRTKFAGSSSRATLFETRADIGTAETPAEEGRLGVRDQRTEVRHRPDAHEDHDREDARVDAEAEMAISFSFCTFFFLFPVASTKMPLGRSRCRSFHR